MKKKQLTPKNEVLSSQKSKVDEEDDDIYDDDYEDD
jgi:hypothetical protein